MKRNYRYRDGDWNPTKRADGLKESLPFIGLLGGVAALVGLLIWAINVFG